MQPTQQKQRKLVDQKALHQPGEQQRKHKQLAHILRCEQFQRLLCLPAQLRKGIVHHLHDLVYIAADIVAEKGHIQYQVQHRAQHREQHHHKQGVRRVSPAVQHGAEHKADDALRAGIKNGGEGAEKNRDQAHGRKYGQAFAKSILQGIRGEGQGQRQNKSPQQQPAGLAFEQKHQPKQGDHHGAHGKGQGTLWHEKTFFREAYDRKYSINSPSRQSSRAHSLCILREVQNSYCLFMRKEYNRARFSPAADEIRCA